MYFYAFFCILMREEELIARGRESPSPGLVGQSPAK
jgi:hypothetical protein